MPPSHCIVLSLSKQCLWRCLLVFALAMVNPGAFAATNVVRVWGAPPAAVQALRNAQPGIIWLSEDSDPASPQVQLQLAWQQDAYHRILATGSRLPVLLLSLQRVPAMRLRSQDSALIWGPPLTLQIQLARRLMPLAKRMGVLYQSASQTEINALASASFPPGVQLVPLRVDAPLTARALAEAADEVDVFIASNDETLFNRETAKLILLTAYHHQRAVIGPTPAFVSAGAVATEAVPKTSLIAAIVARVMSWQESGSLGDSQSINRFAPVFNEQVARSLSLHIPSDLRREVQP